MALGYQIICLIFLSIKGAVALESSYDAVAPKISIPEQWVEETIGADVTLVCDLESNPKPVTYWTREGGGFMIIPNTKYNSILIDTGVNKVQMRLIIKNLSPDDFGSYTCVAKNSAGEAEGNITLYEISELHSSTYPYSEESKSSPAEKISEPSSSLEGLKSSTAKISPKIRIPNRRMGAAIGANVTLRCNLKSNPKSVTYWTQGGGGFMVFSNTKYNSILIDKGINKVQMSLIIKNLGPDDFGSYSCVAKNSVGEAEGTITLYEKSEPHSVASESNTTETAPMIHIPHQLVRAAIGEDVTLVCNLKSNPRSIIYWTREGGGFMVISNAKYNSHLIDTGNYTEQMRLIIKKLSPDDFGSYKCVAKNSLGEDEGEITLYEIPEPHSSTYPSSEGLANNAAESDGLDTEDSLIWSTLSTIALRLLF